MNYLAFIGSPGAMPEAAVAEMNRDFPTYLEEMDPRGVRLAGRELALPNEGATVRVREGKTLVIDGPFAETKEHIAGIDLLDCADLEEAVEVESKSPVARFLPFEIRPLADLRVGPGLSAFGDGDDSAGVPHLLMVWIGGSAGAPGDERSVSRECGAWRGELEARGALILGSGLGGPGTATTLRFINGATQLTGAPFLGSEEFVGAVEVVTCTDLDHAIELAATHPLARRHVIEARPFHGA